MTRPITYFSIYRSNGREWRAKVLRGQQVLSVLGFGDWVGRQATTPTGPVHREEAPCWEE